LIAYCGIECSKCNNYIATQSENKEELKTVAERLSKIYCTEVKPEYVICDGCRGGSRKSYFCENLCKIHKCCTERKYYSCMECAEFMCNELQSEIKYKPEAIENLNKLKNSEGVNSDRKSWNI